MELLKPRPEPLDSLPVQREAPTVRCRGLNKGGGGLFAIEIFVRQSFYEDPVPRFHEL